MRILFWSPTFLPILGGAEILGFELARALRDRGHEVLVVTDARPSSGLSGESSIDDVGVRRFGWTAPLVANDPAAILRVKQSVARCKAEFAPDVVHVLLFGVDVLIHRLTAGARPAPEVATLQQPVVPLYQRPKSPVEATLRAARWLVAPSEATLRWYRAAIPGIEARSSVVLNALPFPLEAPSPPANGPPAMVCAGRLQHQKGFDLAIRAVARLRRCHPALRLVIAGDGPARSVLERLATELGVADAVEFRGWVAPGEIPRLLRSASVVVMPSRDHELFGLVALQAAQMARPIVASSLGGLREVVMDGVTGVLVPPDDDGALADAVGAVLANSRHAATLGAAARRRAEEVFVWDRFVDSHETIYAAVTSRASR